MIISDALRYEVAKELVERLERDKKFAAVDIEPQIGVLPSYTRLGMASLLPHKEINIDENYDVFVDGKPCSNLAERDEILKAADPHAASIQYDVLKKYKRMNYENFLLQLQSIFIIIK